MDRIIQSLYDRKSVRAYAPDPIPPEAVDAILEAAAQAPTAGNQQLYTILDITDPTKKQRLSESCDHQPFIAEAKLDRKSTRLNSSHPTTSRMPSSA